MNRGSGLKSDDADSLVSDDEKSHFQSVLIDEAVDPRGRWSKKLPWTRRVLFWDWVVAVGLLIVSYGITLFEPFHQDIIENDPFLSYPVKFHTVPSWLCVLLGAGLPVSIFIVFSRFLAGDSLDALRAMLGLIQSISITQLSTAILKNFVGRPRPNFFQLCQYSNGLCQNRRAEWDAFRSFPSGHSSFAFSGLLFLSLWLLGKSRISCSFGPSFAKMLCSMTPIALALFIAASRIRDRWHHHSDVIAGVLIGSSTSLYSYRTHFPSIWHPTCPDRPFPLPPESDF